MIHSIVSDEASVSELIEEIESGWRLGWTLGLRGVSGAHWKTKSDQRMLVYRALFLLEMFPF